jgi:hypothetical protein
MRRLRGEDYVHCPAVLQQVLGTVRRSHGQRIYLRKLRTTQNLF